MLSADLGALLADLGQRVLLVDADAQPTPKGLPQRESFVASFGLQAATRKLIWVFVKPGWNGLKAPLSRQ